MSPMIRRPARRSVTLGAVRFLMVVALAGCVVNSRSVADPPTTSQASSGGEQRLGCSTYCQSAGGIAGRTDTGQDAVTIVSRGTVTPDADGYIPVILTCNLSEQCRGALVVQGVSDETESLARSDLLVGPGATATFGVHLPPALMAYIRAYSPPCGRGVPTNECPAAFFVLADTGPTFGCARLGDAEPGLPSCHGPVNGFRVLAVGDLTAVPSE
jgi:hypothetical protein